MYISNYAEKSAYCPPQLMPKDKICSDWDEFETRGGFVAVMVDPKLDSEDGQCRIERMTRAELDEFLSASSCRAAYIAIQNPDDTLYFRAYMTDQFVKVEAADEVRYFPGVLTRGADGVAYKLKQPTLSRGEEGFLMAAHLRSMDFLNEGVARFSASLQASVRRECEEASGQGSAPAPKPF
jgi:hypothetical protein